jgi:hypothetical protein
VSVAFGTGAATSSTYGTTSTMVMKTPQKALTIVVLIILGGALIYETRKASALTAKVQNLEREQVLLTEQNETLARQRDEALNKFAALRDQKEAPAGNMSELLRLRGEVSRLRSSEKEAALEKAGRARRGTPLPTWQPDRAANVGRGRPEDALQTYIWSGMTTNSGELAACVVADENDPPDKRSVQRIIDNPQEQVFKGLTQLTQLSQTPVSANEVLLEFTGRPGPDLEVTRTMMLRNVNGEWRLVLFNQRDADGKITHVAPWAPLSRQ